MKAYFGQSVRRQYMNLHCYVILGQSCLILLQQYSICHQILTKVCFLLEVFWDRSLLKLICLKVELK